MTDETHKLPAYVSRVEGEVVPGYWHPCNFDEWNEMQRTGAFLSAWVAQQSLERSLRKMIGIWVFVIISLQSFGVFTLVLMDAFTLLKLQADVVKLLLPSVLVEMLGMGWVVVRYLFRAPTDSAFPTSKRTKGKQ